MSSQQRYTAYGKLLIFGEYVVLDGCMALSWPTRFGQYLEVQQIIDLSGQLIWKSLNSHGDTWFEAIINSDFKTVSTTNFNYSQPLERIFEGIRQLNPDFSLNGRGHELVMKADYPTEWGLGSSSTLLSLLAQWAEVDPMKLFFLTQTGSGYDVATATAKGPILYTLGSDDLYKIEEVRLNLKTIEGLHFVYLGNKQSSAEGIQHYKEQVVDKAGLAQEMNQVVMSFYREPTRSMLLETMRQSEDLLSGHLSLKKVKELYFSDFPGEVKSLGAWGGDFVMALAESESFDTAAYFLEKGYSVVFKPHEVLL